MSAPYTLATDYYDGATEGFLVDSAQVVRYFRLIAWDGDQDQRLFVVADVDPKELSRVESLLQAAGQGPKRHVWLPEWKFSGSDDAAEADEIVERCRDRLAEVGQLALGKHPDESKLLSPLTDALRQDVVVAINRNSADVLEHWLTKLSR